MEGADEIMNSTLFLGTYPGLTMTMLQTEITAIASFCQAWGKPASLV